MKIIVNKFNLILYILTLGSIVGGAMFHVELFALLVAAICGILLVLHNYNLTNNEIPTFCFLLIVFQNFLIGIGAHFGENTSSSLKLLTQIPSICIFCSGGICLIRKRIYSIMDYFGLVIIVYITFQFVVSNADITARLVYFRNCTIPFFSYWIGEKFADNDTIRRFSRVSIAWSSILIIVGFILIAMPVNAWEAIGLKEVYIAKGAAESFYATGFPIRYYTTIGNFRTFRLASIIFEPVNLGYILAFGTCILFLDEYNKFRLWQKILIVFGLVMTFGKGGMLVCGITITYCILFRIILVHLNISSSARKRIGIIILLFLVTVIGFYFYNNIGGSAMAHFRSIISTMSDANRPVFGAGLGHGGNFGTGGHASGQESGLMSILYQLGVPFTLFFIYSFLKILYWIDYDKTSNSLMAAIFPVAIIVAALFQENTLGPQCCYLFMCYAGMYARKGYSMKR